MADEDIDINKLVGKARGLKDKAVPLAEFKLNYDAFAETLEPVYFWILDYMQQSTGGLGMKMEKIVDNFTASPGSGYFADIGARATRMQDQGMKILGTINTVMRSVLNLIYDLKEFELRLEHYDRFKSKDERKAEGGLLALKQVWMDRVDIRKGGASINMLAQQLDFVTLRDAFMKAKKPEDVDRMDLNERVKRMLKPRIAEFYDWVERSEKELRTRYELQRTYLKSQVSALKLYTRWVKPYLKAAEDLAMMSKDGSADLVKAFNTIVLELHIMGTSKFDIEVIRKGIGAGTFPQKFWNARLKQPYYSCVFVNFSFRGQPRIASRAESAHYVHGGKANITFKAFALSEEELNKLKKEIENQDIYEGIKLVSGVTADSLEPIYNDLVKYMAVDKKEDEKKELKRSFLDWLIGEKPKEKEGKKKEQKKKEDFIGKQVREMLVEGDAIKKAWTVYHLYKKAHGMPTPLHEYVSQPEV